MRGVLVRWLCIAQLPAWAMTAALFGVFYARHWFSSDDGWASSQGGAIALSSIVAAHAVWLWVECHGT